VALGVAVFVLLAGPTVLAFYTGGYSDESRAWTGLGAWVLVLAGALLVAPALPRRPSVRVAWAGLGLLAVWTLASMAWAPVRGSAYHAGQLAFLYLGALIAATLLLRGRAAVRVLEPALLAGTAIVVGYGISERLLPGLLHFTTSVTAEGRLEQPLTYWNAEGVLAAIGLVLAIRVAGDASRSRWLRTLAPPAGVLLGLAIYLSFSRGALFAALAGLIALLVLAPSREQVTSAALVLLGAVVVSAVAAPQHGVSALTGTLSARESQGAIELAVLVLVGLACALGQLWLAARQTPAAIRLPSWAPGVATGVICVALALALALGAKEKSAEPARQGASRLVTLSSDRFSYWDVALRAFAQEPVHGVGAENWWVYWLRDRPNDGAALDAHSLELQTLAELGLVGAAFLLVWFAGVGVAARRAYRAVPGVAAGPLAGVIVWVVHSPLDWDWQLPALSLVAVVLAGGLLALAETARLESAASRADRPPGPTEAAEAVGAASARP
jgi:hypothetical protein